MSCVLSLPRDSSLGHSNTDISLCCYGGLASWVFWDCGYVYYWLWTCVFVGECLVNNVGVLLQPSVDWQSLWPCLYVGSLL